jgi:DNA-binding transcriptional regulator GbsR (MarR family)
MLEETQAVGPLTPLEEEFVASLGDLGAAVGMNRVVAQIYAVLYLREGPVSLEELASLLGVSKATISLNTRGLERWGGIERTGVGGRRKGYYTANRDTLRVVLTALRSGLGRRLGRVKRVLDRLEELGRDEARGGAKRERERKTLERVREVQGMVDLADRLLKASSAVDLDTLRRLVRWLPRGGG